MYVRHGREKKWGKSLAMEEFSNQMREMGRKD